MTDPSGRWCPSLSKKQVEVWNDTRRHLLLSGPRLCGKSIVAVHKVIKHCWLTPNARAGIFVKSTKVGISGVWSDLIDYAIPLWIEELGEQGFRVIEGPAIRGDTRQRFIKIANVHGGESEITLNSLHHGESVVEKMKGTRWSALFFDEIDVYDTPEVFEISVLQLRSIGLAYNKHLWIGTCNPHEEGQDHWLYKKWWVDPYDEKLDAKDRATFGLYEFNLLDNIFLKEEEISRLKSTYANDPDSFKRFVEGKWVADLRTCIFAGAFMPLQHVKGSIDDGTIILPTDRCTEIITGWDLGNRNHSVTFMEHVVHGAGDYYAILDEVCHINEDISIETMTLEVVAKMRELEALFGKKLKFKSWSDKNAFDYRSSVDARDHILVHTYSKGEIELIGCPKGPNSVPARIALTRQLLIQKRLYISAHCLGTVEMFKKLSKGKTKGDHIRRDKAGHIHRFDSLSYALFGENIEEIDQSLRPKLSERATAFTL